MLQGQGKHKTWDRRRRIKVKHENKKKPFIFTIKLPNIIMLMTPPTINEACSVTNACKVTSKINIIYQYVEFMSGIFEKVKE